MRKRIKNLFSLVTVILFIGIGLASFGPDGSTNTSVAIKDCEWKPEVENVLRINVSFTNTLGEPIPEAGGEIFIMHQQVNPGDECTFQGFTDAIDLYTGPDGKFSYTSPFEHKHDNSEDLYRVEINIPNTALYTGCKQVQVLKYSAATFNFNCIGKRLSDL